LVTCEVSKAGLLGELANSFLVIGSKHDLNIPQPNWLVWSERLTKNVTLNSTTTLENLDDRLVVRKEYPNLSHQGSDALNRGFKLNSFPDQQFLHGASVELELLRYAVAGNAANFLQTLREWMEFAKQEFALRNPNALADQAWDCIPRNLIRLKNGTLEAFDLEFGNERPFCLEVLCSRGLLTWFLDHSFWAAKLNPNAKTVREQIAWVLSTLFPKCNPNITIENTIQRETEFHMWVNCPEKKIDLLAAIDTPILPYQSASILHAEVIQLRDHNARLEAFVDAVRKTVVYRLYRRIIRLLKE
jgi:hypothetical protein